jgi:hypothetical protein
MTESEREKFGGPNVNPAASFVNGEMIIHALTEAEQHSPHPLCY